MISSPTLLLDWKKAQTNIARIADKAKQHGLHFRPHFKTHMSQAVGRHFQAFGVDAITVSSLSMADYFAADGWRDITVAFPVNWREIEIINRLAQEITLNLLLVNPESAVFLREHLLHPVGIFIKIDSGAQRTGLLPEDEVGIEAIFQVIESSPMLQFEGFLTHAGHSYRSRSKEEVLAVHEETLAMMNGLKEKYKDRYPILLLSPGDTPTCSIAENWDGMDEIRPGNFVFHDLMQVQIGSCKMEDIAVALACPIVAKHADRQELVIYGGAVHLSKDSLFWEGKNIFGLPVLLDENGWQMPEDGCHVRSLSQEHGVVSCTPSFFEKVELGGLLGILPVHSCLTVDLGKRYLTTDGEVWEKM